MQPFGASAHEWNSLIASLPMPHLLQSWEWSEVKARNGWQASPVLWTETGPAGRPLAAAMLLKRSLPVRGFAGRLGVLYLPKGPNLDWSQAALRDRVLDDLEATARREQAIFLKLDPDVVLGSGVPGAPGSVETALGRQVQEELRRRGWRFSADQIQFRNTVLIDLEPGEDELLGRMKQKTRYNVRLAMKKGVRVRAATASDHALLYRMYAETSVRDGFLIRGEEYYRSVWQTFPAPPAAPGQPCQEALIAEVDGQPVAAISLFYFASQAIYLFGMSREVHREKMPNYLLQWEAIRRAKALGCRVYNLWGAPDKFEEQDGLWHVFRFKEGLGGVVSRTLGAWDYAPSPWKYRLYTETLPRIMAVARSRGQARTRESLAS